MINNAKDKFVRSSLPNVSSALMDWFQSINLNLIISRTENYEVIEEFIKIKSKGVWQPFSAQQLNILPEGHRAWSWFMVHVLPNVVLNIYDRIEYEGEVYRVMRKTDYSKYGYYEYDVIYDYQYPIEEKVEG